MSGWDTRRLVRSSQYCQWNDGRRVDAVSETGARRAALSHRGCQGCSGAGTRGTASPTFSTGGTRTPLSPLFWTEIRAKVSPLLQLVTY